MQIFAVDGFRWRVLHEDIQLGCNSLVQLIFQTSEEMKLKTWIFIREVESWMHDGERDVQMYNVHTWFKFERACIYSVKTKEKKQLVFIRLIKKIVFAVTLKMYHKGGDSRLFVLVQIYQAGDSRSWRVLSIGTVGTICYKQKRQGRIDNWQFGIVDIIGQGQHDDFDWPAQLGLYPSWIESESLIEEYFIFTHLWCLKERRVYPQTWRRRCCLGRLILELVAKIFYEILRRSTMTQSDWACSDDLYDD